MSTTSTDVSVVEVGFGHGERQLAGGLGECESIRLDVCSRSSRRPRPGEVLSLSRRGAPDISPDHASLQWLYQPIQGGHGGSESHS